MGLMQNVKNWIQPQRDPNTLNVSIEEIPQPRDWGTVQLTVGNSELISRDISLEASATDDLLGWLERNLPKIKASGYQKVQFENVAEPLQQRIQALLRT
jgi:hypothetical protein